MDTAQQSLIQERLQQVIQLAHARLPADRQASFDAFAAECFTQIDGDDLAERSNDDLAGALLSHWQFGGVESCE